MRPELKAEIERLHDILAGFGLVMKSFSGAPPETIGILETETGMKLDQDLIDFYSFTNGTPQKWFVVMTDELTPCDLLPVDVALKWWKEWLPYDQSMYEEWTESEYPRDLRIRPGWLKHSKWLQIADFNCGGTSVNFDADPSGEGKYGQIIAYQHDPDAMYYVADSFLEFFKLSNTILAEKGLDILFVDGKPIF